MSEQSRSDDFGPIGLTIDKIRIGDRASFGKTLTEADVYQFAGILGNFNPLYVNTEFAAQTPLKRRVVPTILVASLVSKVLGTQLPGNGTVHIAEEMEFLQPAFIGDTIEATIEVFKLDGRRCRIWFDIVCTNQEGEIIARGETEVKPPCNNCGRCGREQ